MGLDGGRWDLREWNEKDRIVREHRIKSGYNALTVWSRFKSRIYGFEYSCPDGDDMALE